MPTHLIRLRKAWEYHFADLAGQVTLPLTADNPIRFSGRVRLARNFGCPPLNQPAEELAIRLEGVNGLCATRVNDRDVSLPDPLPDPFEIRLVEPMARNRLVLEVEFGPDISRRPENGAADCEEWGRIALVVYSSS